MRKIPKVPVAKTQQLQGKAYALRRPQQTRRSTVSDARSVEHGADPQRRADALI
jgi:hypothetical protein